MALSDKLTAIADGFRERDGTTALLTLDEMAELARQGGGVNLVADVPTTQGEWACLARAAQMSDIKYTPKATMYNAYDDIYVMQTGTEYTGLIYSSVRALDWFIGYTIPMYSYLTCLNNPKSIIYTKKYTDYFAVDPELDPTDRANSIVYNVYGTNCSSFVSYCIDLPYLHTTGTIPNRADITRLCEGTDKMTDFDALRSELRLCDIAGCITAHTELVTGIWRDKNGVIQEVELTDSWPPRIRRTTYTWEDFVKHCSIDYDYPFLRYSNINSVSFAENLNDIVYSDIVTNRGDKITIRPDMDISLNVLGSGYAGIKLFKDGALVQTQPSTADWELTNLSTGKYMAILYKTGETVTIDDANEHNSTSFIVCNVSISLGENSVYTYTAEAIEGVYPAPVQLTWKDRHGFTINSYPIESNEFTGSDTMKVLAWEGMVQAIFKTEYGFVMASCLSAGN